MNELEQLQQENEALRLALQAQQEINHYKQFFLARIAHELRSPLSSLMSLQQLILHDLCDNPAEEKEFLTDANTAAKRLLTMIDDLVMVAKVDYGKTSLDCGPIALSDLLAELEYTVKLPVGNHNFRLEFCLPDALPPINGDRHKILWVLRNLIDRALESTLDKSGIIKLEAKLDHHHCQILVSLQLPCVPDVWQFSFPASETEEIVDSNHLQKISHKFMLSPAVTWQLAQTLMGKMGGSLAALGAIAQPNSVGGGSPPTVVILALPTVDLR